MGYPNLPIDIAPENRANKPDIVVLYKDKETWIIVEGTVCNTGCIHERTLYKQQKYTDLRSGLKRLYPNDKVGQVNGFFRRLQQTATRGRGKSRLK